ncbi:hypothetical protein E2320_000518 [Naja naja]|nr:hypothetical protein E2320_000518 [Naja naja]
MKVAVAGCCHGALDKLYETLQLLEQRHGDARPDLLLCAGDFQAVRNAADLRCMAVPSKYRQLGGFAKYYSGEKKAPILTIFIGGNHEASNHLQELPYGGWVAPNIYYLGHFEYPPYNQETVRSIYHVRNIEVFKLKQLKQPMDVFLSHDWPRSIYHYGNKTLLLKKKSFFRSEADNSEEQPKTTKWDYSVTEEDIKKLLEEVNDDLVIPQNFSITEACYNSDKSPQRTDLIHRISPQTTEFCARFSLVDINARIQQRKEQHRDDVHGGEEEEEEEEEENEEEIDTTGSMMESSANVSSSISLNPDEILLDEDSCDDDLEASEGPSSDFSCNASEIFSDIRILPGSMVVSPNDTLEVAEDELEKSSNGNQAVEQSPGVKPLKRLSDENKEGTVGLKKIKRRNQAIYASKDEDETLDENPFS